MVRCTSCGQSLPPAEFHRQPRKVNGLSSWCKSCHNAGTQRWRADNRVPLNARRRQPPHDKVCVTCGKPFTTTRSAKLYCVADCRNQRHRWRPTGHNIGRQKRERVLTRDGWLCYLCDTPIDRTVQWPHPLSRSVDHVIPRSRGGTDDESNLRAAHWRCNEAKGARTITNSRIRVVDPRAA
jgi:5-methylcytosine-specific restriction endonuclease McrA